MRRSIDCSKKFICIFFLQLAALYSLGFNKKNDCGHYPCSAVRPSETSSYQHDTFPATDTFNFYVSNQGLSSNGGTTPNLPKQSIGSISSLINSFAVINKKVSLGLEANSIFREQYDVSVSNIKIGSFKLQDNIGERVAQITGMDIVNDWKLTQGKNSVYEYTVNHSLDLTNPNYNYLFVAEIDTALEKLHPVSAIKYLPLVSTLDKCDALPGSFFISTVIQNPISIYIHATTGIPGKNKFRYEVVKRPFTINGFYQNDGIFENLYLRSSGNGYGMLSAGKNTVVRNITFQGGGTHHSVIKGGVVDHSLFLPGPKGLADEIALVFYTPDGSGNNKISNSVFLDIAHPIFSHTDGASNYASMSIDSVYAFADTLNSNYMLSGDNTDSVIISNSYGTDYKNFWIGKPSYLSIRNSIIHNASEAAIYIEGGNDNACNVEVINTLITTNGNDNNQLIPPRFQSCMGFGFTHTNTSLKVSNSIFHGRSTWKRLYETVFVFTNTLSNKLEASNNIYICDVNPDSYLFVGNANNSNGKGTASNIVSDYNVYILLRGVFQWRSYPTSPNGDGSMFSFKDWQLFTGQDQHSIFIDLRNNPAGLKAIFTDPENGNWTFLQTPLADSIRKLKAGMLTPPLYYPLKPTYEDALDHMLPGGLSYLKGDREFNRLVKLEWKTINEPNFAYFGVESSTDKINYSQVLNLKTLGKHKDNLYGATLTDSSYTQNYYRLRLVNADSSYNYTNVISITPSKKDSIVNGIGSYQPGIVVYPNPVHSRLTVEHPPRDQAHIKLYDYTGRMLQSMQVQSQASTTSISLAGFAAGRYLIEWRSGNEKKAVSFVKVN